jgi:hypothetical protein
MDSGVVPRSTLERGAIGVPRYAVNHEREDAIRS